MSRAVYAVIVLVAALFHPGAEAQAHSLGRSYTTWIVDGATVTVRISAAAVETTRLRALPDTGPAPLDRLLARHAETAMEVHAAGAPCERAAPARSLAARTAILSAELIFSCAGPIKDLSIRMNAFFAAAPDHSHFARIKGPDGRWHDHVFTARSREARIALASKAPSGWLRTGLSFAALGTVHILEGLDHLAFLAGLLLLIRSWRGLVLSVTGFTAGHSATLALATLGWIEPNVPVIEALIGFTIVLVAAEAAALRSGTVKPVMAAMTAGLALLVLITFWTGSALPLLVWAGLLLFTGSYGLLLQSTDMRRFIPALAGLFGLIHGCGFARVLMDAGLQTDQLAVALVGFNLGVEAGQLLFLAVLAGLGHLVRRFAPPRFTRPVFDMAAASLTALGVFWFVSRSIVL